MTASNVSEFTTATVGHKYRKWYSEVSAPWLDNNESLQTAIKKNHWVRWDGVEGTAETHMDWIYTNAKSLMSQERRSEYRPYGEKNGIKYFIHDELTKEGRGHGFFLLEGELELEPRDMVAAMFNFSQTAESDPTVVYMKVMKTYKNPKDFVCAAYWCNNPGFPFSYRDGFDLSGYRKDDDGTMWQLAVSARGKDEFVSMPGALKAVDRYWAYKLTPIGNGKSKVTLICQTQLNGYIPPFLSNYFVCKVLIDYMSTTEEKISKNKQNGSHQSLLKTLDLLE